MNFRHLASTALLAATVAGCASSSDGADTSSGSGGGTPAPLEITVEQGIVVGTLNDATRAFRGIPYAAPPTGENRFRPPQPSAPWANKHDGSAFGPKCPQSKLSLGGVPPKYDDATSEDCLTLNVWAPAKVASPRPVMVWVHGGAFEIGSGDENVDEGTNLSKAGGAVVVTLNYRLGPLGFAAHEALSAENPAYPASGNYGLLDQRAALEWVKQNIAAFGGDPNNVTLFGESAGAISACAHLVSPGSAGLFHRAIAQSGMCAVLPTMTKATAEAQGKTLSDAVGCTGDATALRACLRSKTPKELVSALPLRPFVIFGEGVGWAPNVDGVELLDQPKALMAAKKSAKVPLVLGANGDEGTLFVKALGAHFADAASLESTLSQAFSPALAKPFAERYQFAQATDFDALAIIGDAFVCDSRRTARLHEAGGNSVWLYHFTRAFKIAIPGLGAFHSAELPFVFQNAMFFSELADEELPLSNAMQGYWTRFARAGDPNGNGATAWPKHASSSDEHLQLDLTLEAGVELRKGICDWMDDVTP
ncbi:MAG: carboxylesterase family protein [Deltaproteobacteria bacterium]|nr:carboxylesterase family protein [Deltaproteobacteria bacterium]